MSRQRRMALVALVCLAAVMVVLLVKPWFMSRGGGGPVPAASVPDLSDHPVYRDYHFGKADHVIDFGTQPVWLPTCMISETMRRDVLLKKALAEQGLEIQFHSFLKGADVNYFLARGDLEVGIGGDMPALSAAANSGVHIVALTQQGFCSIVAREDMLMKELRGKRIAYAFGSNAHYALLQSLASAGLRERDVRLIPLDVTEMPDALADGTINAFSAWEPTPTIALRADMDALKIKEKTGLPFASEVEDVMHACGHDAHTAILLGVAQVLRNFRDIIPGNIKFVFQPSEEAFPGGALPMIQEGLLENPKVDAALALHLDNTLPTGKIAVRHGPSVAGVTSVNITIRGSGGHFAAPHETVDPIVVAAHIIVAIQSLVTRQIDGRKPFVLTFGQVLAGTRDNIIPEEVIIRGDMAATDNELRESIEQNILKLVRNMSLSLGACGEISFWRGYPTLINNPAIAGLVQDIASELIGADNVVSHAPWMTGEDFAFIAEKVPSALWFLGSWDKDKYPSPTRHHDPRFDLDEGCIPMGIELAACMALEYLHRYREGGKLW